jgi:hypothetical protein
MHKIDHWKDQMSFYRFCRNARVTEKLLIACVQDLCVSNAKGIKHVLLLEDTTEINLEKHRFRITDKKELGVVGNNVDLGFFCHASMLVDAENKSLIGLPNIHLWHRKEDKAGKKACAYKHKSLEEKESYRWSECGICSQKILGGEVDRITVVQDREGDIYESFCRLKSAGLDFVIRCAHDRKLSDSEIKLKKTLRTSEIAGKYQLSLPGNNPKRKKRIAKMTIHYSKVSLSRPDQIINKESYPASLTLYVVHVTEDPSTVPANEKPVEWTLYTTHAIKTSEDALRIVGYYTARWMIEDLFRCVKSEGLNFEKSELESGQSLRKLFIITLMASFQILQLRQARDGNTSLRTSFVFSEEEIACMQDFLPRFEGKTDRLKNPHPIENLAWATWLIARMGGWKGYSSQRPPGVIILHDGWIRFHNMFEGWAFR